MADGAAVDKTDMDQYGVSSGAAEIRGGTGDISSLMPITHATPRAQDEDDDSVFYSEKDFLPDRTCQDPALVWADLSGVIGDLSQVLTLEPSECQAEPGMQPFAAIASFQHAATALGDHRGPIMQERTVQPADCLPADPEDQIPVDPKAQGSEKILNDSPTEVPRGPKTQKEAEVQTMERFDAWKEPMGWKMESSVPTPSPEEVLSEESEGEGGPVGVLTKKDILSQSQDMKEKEERREVNGTHETCTKAVEETPSGGSRKKSIDLDSISKYNTVSYRKIRKGNTRQKINEFESMMNT